MDAPYCAPADAAAAGPLKLDKPYPVSAAEKISAQDLCAWQGKDLNGEEITKEDRERYDQLRPHAVLRLAAC